MIFGSYARGEFKKESDLDVLIIGDVELDGVIGIAMSRDYFEMLKAEEYFWSYGLCQNMRILGESL